MANDRTFDRYEDWQEEDSDDFLNFGWAFVPDREIQRNIVASLVPIRTPLRVIELCSGEGLLAEEILRRYGSATVTALDRSPKMLAEALRRLAEFKERIELRRFDLEDQNWRTAVGTADCFVSSLAFHHLSDHGKAVLFADLFNALTPGGRLIVADLIQPQTSTAQAVWAEAWDQAVRDKSLARFGDLRALEAFKNLKWNHFIESYADPVDQPSSLFAQLQWLKQAGYVAIDVHWMNAGHAIFSADRPG